MCCHSVACGTRAKRGHDAISYAKFFSRSHDAVIRVHDEAGNVIETHEHMAISRGHDQLFSTSLGVLPNC